MEFYFTHTHTHPNVVQQDNKNYYDYFSGHKKSAIKLIRMDGNTEPKKTTNIFFLDALESE